MENLEFFYDFEISKQGLTNCLNIMENQETKTYGDATVFYVQMGLASLTLLENAFKGVNFDFQPATLTQVELLLKEIFSQYNENKISQNSYLTYLQLLGAYFGWCSVKKYKAYFATVENQKLLILNNKSYNPTLIVKSCSEENKSVEEFFNEINL